MKPFREVSRDEFVQWLRSKPADTPACLSDTGKCVMAQFAIEKFDVEHPDAAESSVYEKNLSTKVFQFESGLSFYQFEGEDTYGEVVKKLEWFAAGWSRDN